MAVETQEDRIKKLSKEIKKLKKRVKELEYRNSVKHRTL